MNQPSSEKDLISIFSRHGDSEIAAGQSAYMKHRFEFFGIKAIGWILREYSKTNPHWVIDFVEKTPLASLSEREALKAINH